MNIIETIQHLNSPPGFRYFDLDEIIDYFFVGFDNPLSVQERLDLIQKFGAPRNTEKTSMHHGLVVTSMFEDAASRAEMQFIYKPDQNT